MFEYFPNHYSWNLGVLVAQQLGGGVALMMIGLPVAFAFSASTSRARCFSSAASAG